MGPEFVVGETDKSADFLKKFPLGKVPAFEDDKICLFEPNAIAYYVGNKQTRGGDNEAEVLQWIGVADNDILPAACTWVYPTMGIMQFNKQNTEKAKNEVKKVMGVLNDHLLHHTFLVGERLTVADISVACTMISLYQNVLDPGFRTPFGNVNRWFSTVVNQPQAKKVLGAIKMAEKMAQFDAKKYAEVSKGGDNKKDNKKEKKPKEEKPKAEKKKEEKPAAAQEAPLEKPKEKDPFAAMPKGNWDMDD